MTPDEEELEWDKHVTQFRMAVGVVLHPLRLYGQQDYVDNCLLEIVSLAIQLNHKLAGVDEPYHINSDKLHY